MPSFKYYKRGAGELDTSNFPDIVDSGFVSVEKIDEKTFMSLLALNEYARAQGDNLTIRAKVSGYVAHMRSDKDEFSPANLYNMLDHLDIRCDNVQHESNDVIKSAQISKSDILYDLTEASPWFTLFVGADGSVPKFFPGVDCCAQKVRTNGKVQSMEFDTSKLTHAKQVIIVDDILGGGATIQMLVDIIRNHGFSGKIHMWVAYNEGFHSAEFLNQFDSHFVGSEV